MISREAVLQTTSCGRSQYPQLLEERFPHVLEKIIKLWDSPEAELYLNDLLQPAGRGGGRMDRDGFPDQAWEEILELKVLHDNARRKSAREVH